MAEEKKFNIKNMKNVKIVAEDLNDALRIGDILKPKSQSDITDEIKRRLSNKNLKIILEKENFIIYQAEKAEDIKGVVNSIGGKEEDPFFNFYLILDNDVKGFNQIIGVKVSPDGTLNAVNVKGEKISAEYLDKFHE